MDRDVLYIDCSGQPMEHLQFVTSEIVSPLLAADEQFDANSEKLADIMYELLRNIEVMRGWTEVCCQQRLLLI